VGESFQVGTFNGNFCRGLTLLFSPGSGGHALRHVQGSREQLRNASHNKVTRCCLGQGGRALTSCEDCR